MLNEAVLREHGIDMGEGLAYCADDPEFYEEMLGEYVAEGLARTDELRDYYKAEDWGNYAIRAHSVKNTSKMIGAESLSERARALELAAKEQDAAVVRAMHEPFLADVQALIDVLQEMLG